VTGETVDLFAIEFEIGREGPLHSTELLVSLFEIERFDNRAGRRLVRDIRASAGLTLKIYGAHSI